ncbi:DUF4097 family beta strand repeat-containing protein [Streptomyces roseoverticillatus]|uniref:DUF4097 family beta strand repeat-containing protein n=1 Tax=Streptomyces roseoverticillatus TaxID=66429 RepID=UPI0004BE87E0|nr:DUF4097 family beta strand repeat-containing protein [Streptomyces roseoverticillatus]
MTERMFVSETTGPVVLGLDLPMGAIDVQVFESVTTAGVVLITDDDSGPAAEAVARARSSQNGQAMTVEVPEIGNNVIMQSFQGNRLVQQMGVVNGTVTGAVIIGGRVMSGGGGGMVTVSPIRARVTLPAGSSLGIVSQSSDARIYGDIEQVEFRSVSGDLHVQAVRHLNASTTSGDVMADRAAGRVTARSVSGDIGVERYHGEAADLSTTSGDVSVTAVGQASGVLRAHSVSGDVTVTGAGALQVSARSVSGRVRTR